MQVIVSKEIWEILDSFFESSGNRMPCRCNGIGLSSITLRDTNPEMSIMWNGQLKPHETVPPEARKIIFNAIERYDEKEKGDE